MSYTLTYRFTIPSFITNTVTRELYTIKHFGAIKCLCNIFVAADVGPVLSFCTVIVAKLVCEFC